MAFGWIDSRNAVRLSRGRTYILRLPCGVCPLPAHNDIFFNSKHTHLTTSIGSIDYIPCYVTRSRSYQVFERTLLYKLQSFIIWHMEDHLCPRLAQPQAACLSCLARPQPLARSKAQGARYYCNHTNTVSTEQVSKPSLPSQAPTQPALRTNYVVQASAVRPTPMARNAIRHMSHTPDLEHFSCNITSTAPAPASHQCETSHLYTRLMQRYTGSPSTGSRHRPTLINSWRDLPTEKKR